ncbi:hypothetical protein Q4530_01100 [Colwellia sp. 1_MG-2023]|uniref:hypothetical protein n=1 Tax=unclassified Colwellia TaxID=196834 RepID=UPI001C0A3E38|nr:MULTISPECIES: hypothetical protein [unclassified Colwellia]MBU2925809.1 hypothetical protein [Colwellia sp. C2M11]MDO6650964.1 hypothetical protein [Colwellia sp. 3_MG-2023]MDO6663999.1 hypothetical protein [Colwellia sp. 2_MG-2023]MDO6688350.1 hypothetical protein [Colwellia sp. 1_MG-2023]
MEIEYYSFNELARRFLDTETLPKSIHDALNNVLTKTHKTQNLDKVKFRSEIVNRKAADETTTKYPIIKGRTNSIYNILILIYLIGTNGTKELLQSYYLYKHQIDDQFLNKLFEQTKKQYLEFFCLGVVRENIDKIIGCFKSSDFNLFEDKLPSPFSSDPSKFNDISPMLKLFSQDIPWEYYMEEYQKAENLFLGKNYIEAKAILQSLNKEALIRLPVIEVLIRKINVEESESKEAWDYLKKILN